MAIISIPTTLDPSLAPPGMVERLGKSRHAALFYFLDDVGSFSLPLRQVITLSMYMLLQMNLMAFGKVCQEHHRTTKHSKRNDRRYV